jgi:hypothetical protein
MLHDNILEEILALPPQERRQLIELISESLSTIPKIPLEPRVLGLSANPDFWISEDFDDPLPDEFWFGEDPEN